MVLGISPLVLLLIFPFQEVFFCDPKDIVAELELESPSVRVGKGSLALEKLSELLEQKPLHFPQTHQRLREF